VQKGHLTRHLIHRETDINKPIKCEHCCRRFSCLRSANKHRRVHFPKIYHPTKVHVGGENLEKTNDIDVRVSSDVKIGKSSYVNLNLSGLIVGNVGG